KAGVEAHQVYWLNGLVHFQQGRLEDAIKEFQSSIDLKPSVAACVMHGQVLFDVSLPSGNFDRYSREVKRDLINSLNPETAEDYLFRGLTMPRFSDTGVYKQGLFKSGQALDDIDKAIEMRPTAIARGLRNLVAGEIALRAGGPDLALAGPTLDALQKAKRLLPDNKYVRFVSLHTHLIFADYHYAINQADEWKAKAALEEARKDAQELKGITNISYVMSRVTYFERMGNTEAALQELKEASSLPETSDLVHRYALLLFELGRDPEALLVLNDRLKLKPDN